MTRDTRTVGRAWCAGLLLGVGCASTVDPRGDGMVARFDAAADTLDAHAFDARDAVTVDAVTVDAVTVDAVTDDAVTDDAVTDDSVTVDAVTVDAVTVDVGMGTACVGTSVERCPPLAGARLVCERGDCVAYVGTSRRVLCNGVWSALNDGVNCGACGRSCANEAYCVAGACVACPAPYSRCGATNYCASNVRTDRAHCGACGHACAENERCVSGRCEACGEGTRVCSGDCVDVTASLLNCGACGRACAADQVCVAGVCVACPAGSVRCAGEPACRPSTELSCGACATACVATAVAQSSCGGAACVSTCRRGAATCAGVTCGTSLRTSDAHCGACGHGCASRTRCVDGVCAAMPLRLLAPISGLSVTSARPTFAWASDDAPEGALVQVCADPACARVEAEWRSTEPRTRAPEALPVGVHFWRALPVRAGVVDRGDAMVWLFAVEVGAITLPRAVADVDGDGRTDTASVRAATVGERMSWSVEVGTSRDGTRRIEGDEAIVGRSTATADRATFVGDVNGDGIGDLLVDSYASTGVAGASSYRVWQGGRTAFASVPWYAFAGAAGDFSTRTFARAHDPVGDVNGDGIGDLAFTESYRLATRIVVVPGGRGERVPGPVLANDCDLTLVAAGDFNGDGRTELVVRPCPTSFTIPATGVWAYGASTVTPLPRCEAARGSVASVAVFDADMDGIDDLQIDGFLYRGGADGLSTARCASAPIP